MIGKKLLLAAASLFACATAAHAESKIVAITAIVEHPALNAVRDGVKEELAKAGFKDGQDIKIVYQTAQGQAATATQIARQFVGMNPAVIVAISTPSTQAVLAATNEIPVVFSAVTDPVGAKLVKTLGTGNGHVTGVSDKLPLAEQLALVKEITPNVKRLGIIYNPGEANSVSSVAEAKELGPKMGLEIIEAPAMKTADVQAATRSLIGRADAAFVPTDNLVVSAMEVAASSAQSGKMPLYAADTSSVARGAIASVGFNYHQVGIETGKQVVRILKGEKPNDMPVVFAKETDLFLNKKSATLTGLTFPEAALKKAVSITE